MSGFHKFEKDKTVPKMFLLHGSLLSKKYKIVRKFRSLLTTIIENIFHVQWKNHVCLKIEILSTHSRR